MHYFVTGHTGFKGAWLSVWLTERGHSVSGLSLDPFPASLFERADLGKRISRDFRCDIRDAEATRRAIADVRPDVVVHLAAQPLVRESYRAPRATFETNVLGTLNVLEATSHTDSVGARLIVTTDKVYRNVGKHSGYEEGEPLGGDDPYSASKAMADLLTHSWTSSFPASPTAIARAGNVVGGGDISEDRLVPDLIRAYKTGQPPVIRYPDAIRPWQHVLDCLNGYQLLIEMLLKGEASGAWNFGPPPTNCVSVGEVAQRMGVLWGTTSAVSLDAGNKLHEAPVLTLNADRARDHLQWRDRLPLDLALEWTIEWERSVSAGRSALDACLQQIQEFEYLPD